LSRNNVTDVLLSSLEIYQRVKFGFQSVLSTPRYTALFILTAIIWIVILSVVENYRLVWHVVLWGSQSPPARVRVFVGLLPLIGGTVISIQEALTVFIGGLSGLLFTTIIYRIRHARQLRTVGTGGIGLMLAAIGGGCGACGSIILAIAGLGTASGVTALPFGGVELLVLSIGLLGGTAIHAATSVFTYENQLEESGTCKLR
jgi:hypothetical protein